MKKFSHHYYNSLLKEADSKEGFVNGIDLRGSYLRELPDFFKDLRVAGRFDVSINQLTSCKNFPKFVGGVINANDNKISSMEGLQYIGDNLLTMSKNPITSLEYLERFSGELIYGLQFRKTKIESLKGIENIPIKELLVSDNKLTTWDLIPGTVKHLEIYNNKLTSWKGMPKYLSRLLCSGNWDIVDFKDYEEVSYILEVSSSIFDRNTILPYMRELGITPPIQAYVFDMELRRIF